MEHLGGRTKKVPPRCSVSPSCDIWDELSDKQIVRGCIAKTPLLNLKESKHKKIDIFRHEALIVEVENGDYYCIEKMGPDSKKFSKNGKYPYGHIDTHKCKVVDDKVYLDNNCVYKKDSIEDWREPSEDTYCSEIAENIHNQPPYSLKNFNCQNLSRNLIKNLDFHPQKAKKLKLMIGGGLELASHLALRGVQKTGKFLLSPLKIFDKLKKNAKKRPEGKKERH